MNQAEQCKVGAAERKSGPDAVNAWVRQGLEKRYAAVLQEALPAEWLDLLGRPHP